MSPVDLRKSIISRYGFIQSGVGTMFKNVPVVLSEALEVRDGPLTEPEIWAFLFQGSRAIQLLFSKENRYRVDGSLYTITPDTLLCCSNGQVRIAESTLTHSKNSVYYPPELYSTTHHSDWALEKMCVFSLGKTLCYCAEYRADRHKYRKLSHGLQLILRSMSDGNPLRRMNMVDVLKACIQHGSWEQKPYSHYIIQLYELVLGPPQKVEGNDINGSKVCEHGERIHTHRHKNNNNKKHHSSFCVHYLTRTSDLSNQNKPHPPPKKWSHSFAHISDLRSLPDGWSKSDRLSFEGGHSRPTSMSRHSSESSENTSPIRKPILHKNEPELIIPYWVQNDQIHDSDHSNMSDESGSFVKPIIPSKEYSIHKPSIDESQRNEESDEKRSIPEGRILSGSADPDNEKERENSPPLPTRTRSRSKLRTQNSMGLHDSQRFKRRQQRYSFSDDGRNSDSLWNALREQRERLRNMHKMRKNKDRHRHTVSSDPLDIEKRSMLSVSSIFEGSYRPNLSPPNSLNGVPFIELLTQEIEEIKRKDREKMNREKLVEVRASTLPKAMERIKVPKSYGSPDSPPSQPPPQPPIVVMRSTSLKKEKILPKMADVALQTSEEFLDSNSNTTTLRSIRSEIGPISIHSSNLEDFTCHKEICKTGKLPEYINERLPPAGSVTEASDSECSTSTLRTNLTKKFPLDRKTSGASDNCKPPKDFYGPEFVLKGGEPNIPVQLVGEKQTSKLWNQPKMVTAVLLNGQRLDIKCLASTTGKQLFDSVVTYLCLGEPFFFGLAYFRDGEYLFLEHDMKLSKCAPPGWNQNKKPLFTFTLYFRVKFYVENINLIRHDFTRHLHYLQMRRDILEDRIQCSEEMALLLAGLALQAEFGDYEERDCVPSYFRPEHYLPHRVLKQLSIENIESAVADAHKQYSNMADTQAEFQFLRETQHLKEYGIHFHKVLKNKKDFTSLSWIGICTYGLLLYDGTNNQRVLENRFAWQQIRQIAFKKNYFSVLPNTIGDNDKPDKLIYFTDNYRKYSESSVPLTSNPKFKKGRYLLHMCTTHHKFQMKMKSRVNPADIFDHGKIGDIYLPGRGLMELALSINAFSTPGNSLQKSPFPQYSESGSVQVTASVGDSVSLNSINLNEVNEDQDAGEVNFVHHAINAPLVESFPDAAKAKFSLSELEQKIASYKMKPMTLASLHQQKLAGIEMPGSHSASPSGSLGKAFVIDESVTANHTVVPSINETINESLLERFARLPSPDSPDELKCLIKLVKNEEYGLGITVVGGHHNGQPAIFIKLVVPGGPADKNGQLKPGDRIIALNGQKIEGLPHDDAVEMIRKAPHNVEFLIAQRKLRNGETMFLFNEPLAHNSNDSDSDEEENRESQLHSKYIQLENDYDLALPEPPPFITENDLVLGNAETQERTVLGEEADKISFTTLSETSMSPPSRVNQHTLQAIVHSEEGGNTLRCTKAAIATLEAAISQYDSQLSDDSKDEWIDTPRHSQSKNSLKWKLKDTTFKGNQSTTNSISKSYLKVDIPSQQTSKKYFPLEKSAASTLNTNFPELTKESLNATSEGVKTSPLETFQNHTDINEGNETEIQEEPTEQNITISSESYPFVNRNVEFKTPLISNLKDEIFGEIFNVVLEKKQGSLGLNVTGGKGTSFKNGCIHVKSLVPGGSADSDGHISVGDKLLEVNGVKLLNVTHKEAVEILRKCGNKVQLRLEREVKLHRSSLSELARLSWHHQAGLNNQDSSPACPTFEKNKPVLDSSTNISPEKKKTGKDQAPYKFVTKDNTFVVDLQKTNAGLGFSVASCEDPFDTQTDTEILRISKLFPSLPASLCGLLEIGDILLEINETTVKGLSHAETMNLLRASPANVRLKICRPAPEILPSTQNDNSEVNRPTDSQVNTLKDPQIEDTAPAELISPVNVASTLAETSSSESIEAATVVSSVFVNIAPSTDQSDVIEPPLPCNDKQESNQEDYFQEIEVTLVKDEVKGLGFTIQSISAQNACYIRSVVQGPALVDGRLKPGDKLVMVNGYDLTKLTHYDVVALLRKTPKTVNLKVVRNLNSENGSLTSSRPCSQNDSLSGSNTSSPVMLREKTISPRGTLSELESEMKDNSRTMVYAPESAVIRIELDKPDNGNLGFSLSSNEKGSGIFIKSINPGGVTAKNAQLLEGDRLLQVNGESVIGLTLPKAIAMLRKSKGKVKLAVSRAPSRSPSRASECNQPKLNYYYYGETPKSPTVSISSEQSVEQENFKNVTLHSPKKGEEHGFNTDSDVESSLLDNSHVEDQPKDITEEELHKSSSILEYNHVEHAKELNKSTHIMHLNHIQDSKVDKFTHNVTRISNRESIVSKSHEEFIQRKVEDAQMSEQRKIAIEIARLPNKGRYNGENLNKFLVLFKAKYNSNLPSEEFEMLMKEKLEFSRRFEDDFDEDEDAVINYVEATVGEDLFRYITYPAPVSGRITEFWKAVWEDEVHVIAMLAAENRNRNSLLLHLPKSTDSPIFCDRLIISLKTLKRSENFIVCHVLIKEQESGDQRHVVHVSFTSWPDQGLPNDPLPLVKLIRCVHFLHKTGPILVHSNVNSGSASVFVIVSTAVRSIELDQQVDLYEITSNLQSQCQEWISTKDEYLLCYKALLTALQNPSP